RDRRQRLLLDQRAGHRDRPAASDADYQPDRLGGHLRRYDHHPHRQRGVELSLVQRRDHAVDQRRRGQLQRDRHRRQRLQRDERRHLGHYQRASDRRGQRRRHHLRRRLGHRHRDPHRRGAVLGHL